VLESLNFNAIVVQNSEDFFILNKHFITERLACHINSEGLSVPSEVPKSHLIVFEILELCLSLVSASWRFVFMVLQVLDVDANRITAISYMRVENVYLLRSLFLCPNLESGVDALL
jgi:hypothetical protein